MKILIVGSETDEAYVTALQLSDVYMEGDQFGVGFLIVPKENHVEGDIFEFIKNKGITHILPFKEFAFWALQEKTLTSVKIATNPYGACKTVENYFELYKECKRQGIAHPKIYRNNNEIDSFPLVAKSRDKREFVVLNNMREVYSATTARNDMVIQKYVEGQVLEVDFIDDWMQARYLPTYTRMMTVVDHEIVKPLVIQISEAFGMKFGMLKFIVGKDKTYFINASPMFRWESFVLNPYLLPALLGTDVPKDVPLGTILINTPSAFVKEPK